MASQGNDAQTQQNTKEEKPEIQPLQIVVKAQVRSLDCFDAAGIGSLGPRCRNS